MGDERLMTTSYRVVLRPHDINWWPRRARVRCAIKLKAYRNEIISCIKLYFNNCIKLLIISERVS